MGKTKARLAVIMQLDFNAKTQRSKDAKVKVGFAGKTNNSPLGEPDRGHRFSDPALQAGRAWRIRLATGQMTTPDFSHVLNRRIDPHWRKARIAARLLLKREAGRAWSARDRRLAARFAADSGVTNRLIDQAVHSERARRKYGAPILGWFR